VKDQVEARIQAILDTYAEEPAEQTSAPLVNPIETQRLPAEPPQPFPEKSGSGEKKRRVQGGVASTNVVLSAHTADNSDVFPQVLSLHVPVGSTVADLTYGRGVFWRKVPEADYTLLKSDLKLGQCWSTLPYEDASIDAVVFDPPYMEGLYRRTSDALAGSGTHREFQRAYSNSSLHTNERRKYHDAVLNAYVSVVPQVKRILKRDGVFIVKCQDEVSANRQKLTHVELIWAYEKHGFYCKDLFVVVRKNIPVISRLLKQEHARKNHSYFLVFVRQDHRSRLSYSNFSGWLRDDIGSVDG
jgi:hypothetical protein